MVITAGGTVPADGAATRTVELTTPEDAAASSVAFLAVEGAAVDVELVLENVLESGAVLSIFPGGGEGGDGGVAETAIVVDAIVLVEVEGAVVGAPGQGMSTHVPRQEVACLNARRHQCRRTYVSRKRAHPDATVDSARIQ